ncbi:hypothetical protein ACF0H5_008663 [Mactra antiquata]
MKFQILTLVILGLSTFCLSFPKSDDVDEETLDELIEVLREYKEIRQLNDEINQLDEEQSRGYVPDIEELPVKDNMDYPPNDSNYKKGYTPGGDKLQNIEDPIDEIANEALLEYLRQKVRSQEPAELDSQPTPRRPDNPNPDLSKRHMELVSRVINEINERFEAMDEQEREQPRSIDEPGAALSGFNAPNQRTREIQRSAEQTEATIEAIALLTADEDLRRELRNLEIFRRQPDGQCTDKINCTDDKNLKRILVSEGPDVYREFRTLNGSCNNINNGFWGSTRAQHQRLLENAYDDKKWSIRTKTADGVGVLPDVRTVSEKVHSVSGKKDENEKNISLALFYFMQFIDHDLAKTPEGSIPSSEDCCGGSTHKFCLPIRVENDDSYFAKGTCINAKRSSILNMCGTARPVVKNQFNEITSYLDASMVYGSSEEEMILLRSFKGGRLLDRTERTLPRIDDRESLTDWACNVTHEDCYRGGDKRLNVHPGLLSYHTIFVRLHNIIAKQLGDRHIEDWDDELIFYETRKIVAAIIQHITYEEMLPILFNKDKLQEYKVSTEYIYDSSLSASMLSVFSIGYRYHHLMPAEYHMFKLSETGKPIQSDTVPIPQETAFLKPDFITSKHYNGLSETSRGMINSACPRIDGTVNAAARNRLFLTSKGTSTDLAALNIIRGREWGLRSYTAYREHCGLKDVNTFEDLAGIMPQDVITKLKDTYANVADIDLWTGLVSEIPLTGSISGETQTCLLLKHFHNLKHGDRFWYENTVPEAKFTEDQLAEIKDVKLAQIICLTLDWQEVQEDIFIKSSEPDTCTRLIRRFPDLSKW